MDSTWGIVFILLAGVVVVVGSILLFRLHAFLALISAAFLVALLTPHSALERYHFRTASYQVELNDELIIKAGPKQGVEPGMLYLLFALDEDGKEFQQVAKVRTLKTRNADEGDAKWTTAEATEGNLADLSSMNTSLRVIHSLDFKAVKKSANASR